MTSKTVAVWLAAFLTLLIGACSDDKSSTPDDKFLTTIRVSPSVIPKALPIGLSQPLSATGYYADGTQKDLTQIVTWSSSADEVATVNPDGLASAVTEGEAFISAHLGDHTSNAVSIRVTSNVQVTDIVLRPESVSIPIGRSEKLTATATLSDGSSRNITYLATYESSAPDIATVNTEAEVTGVTLGEANVTAALGSIRSNSITVSITDAVANSLLASPAIATIAIGLTQQYQAFARFSDGSTRDVSDDTDWSSDNDSATINSDGVATGVSAGLASIKAHFADITSQAILEITPAAITAIAISPDALSLPTGTTQQYIALAKYSDDSTLNITNLVQWQSSNADIAALTPSGVLTAGDVGTATVSASLQDILSNLLSVTVTAAAQLDQITVTPSTTSGPLGLEQQFNATGHYSDTSVLDITESVSWSSSDTSVATINENGVAMALSTGSTNITAQMGNIASEDAEYTVSNPDTLSLSAPGHQDAKTLVGAEYRFQLFALFSDNLFINVTNIADWQSGDNDIAFIKSPGTVQAAKAGQTEITANFRNATLKLPLTVVDERLQSLTITGANQPFPEFIQQKLNVLGETETGNVIDLTNTAIWYSDNDRIATISTNGTLTAIAAGTSLIHADINRMSSQQEITINEDKPVSLTLAPQAAEIPINQYFPIQASAQFESGATWDVTYQTALTSDSAADSILTSLGQLFAALTSDSAADSILTSSLGQLFALTLGAKKITGEFLGKTSAPITLTASADPLENIRSITLNIDKTEMRTSDITRYRVIATFSDNSENDITGHEKLKLKIADPLMLNHNVTNDLIALNPGETNVTAQIGEIESSPVSLKISK